MVEIAVALTVLGIGLLSLLALIGRGISANTDADEEDRAAMFARATLDGLRADATMAAETNGWSAFWDELMADQQRLSVPAEEAWVDGDTLAIQVNAASPVRNAYTNVGLHADRTDIRNSATRYQLQVEYPGLGNTNLAIVLLDVWPGMYGSTDTTNAHTFYTHILKPGGLQ